jgi:hypothetical protein
MIYNAITNIGGIIIYEDKYMVDGEILKGKKSDTGELYIVTNPKTSSLIYKSYVLSVRKEKLVKLNNI